MHRPIMLKYMYQLLQYHSNVSYHHLARKESHISRNKIRIARNKTRIARNKTRLARNKNCLTRNYMYMYRPQSHIINNSLTSKMFDLYGKISNIDFAILTSLSLGQMQQGHGLRSSCKDLIFRLLIR